MKNKIIQFVLIFFIGYDVSGQSSYLPLVSKGIIPDDFILSTEEKIEDEVLKIDESHLSRKERKYKTDFAFGSNFGVDAMLLNGSVLYNDSISNYLKKVAKEILSKDEDLYHELRFYTIKDETANAFTTANGIIFVTTGLIARLKNEAQLAYILCHEISHFTLKHGETDYVKKQKVINGDREYKGVSFLDKMHLIFGYSKNSEYEADEEGLALFLDSKYDKESAITSFEILMHADEPIGDVPFDFENLEGESYTFPEKYFLEELVEKKERSDTFSTHPSADKRMYNIEELIEDKNWEGDTFIVGFNEFKRIKYMSSMESLLAQIKIGAFIEAMQNANYLKEVYPNNTFIRNVETYCIYSLSKAALEGDKSDYIIKGDFGNLSETNYFFKKIMKNDLLFLATKQAYMNYAKEEQNTFAKRMFKDLVKDMVGKKFMFKDFAREAAVNVDSIERDSSFYFNRRGKRLTKAQIKRKIDREKKKEVKHYYYYSFVEFFKAGDKFEETYEFIEDEVKGEIALEVGAEEEKKEINMSSIEYVKSGIGAGIDSVLFIYPNYKKVVVNRKGVRERKGKKALKNSEKEASIVESFENSAEKLDLHFDVLKERGDDAMNTDRYNGRAMIFSSIMDRSAVGFRDQLIFNGQYIDEINKQFGTSNVAFMSMVDVNYPGSFNPLNVLLIPVYGIGIPVIIYRAIPSGITTLNFVIIDLETGKVPFYYGRKYRGNFSKKKTDVHTYHILNQVKSKYK